MNMHFTQERISRILKELYSYIKTNTISVNDYKLSSADMDDKEFIQGDTTNWKTFNCVDRWGGECCNYYFRTEIIIPEILKGKTVTYEINTGIDEGWDKLNPQFLLYINGEIIQGLDSNHRSVLLTKSALSGERFSIALKANTGMKAGQVQLFSSISEHNAHIEKLYFDIGVPLQIAALLPNEDKKKIDILKILNETINILDLRKPFSKSFFDTISFADKFIDEHLYKKDTENSEIIAHCVGHTHIDVAWLWTLAQTREKTIRSFSTVLNLMEQYPEYIFMSSQPQLYKFVKEDYPGIYSKIVDKVKEGKWEAEGALWLEADCNISSGESLVRHLIFGIRFFEKEFNIENKILWLPDVFGYSAALPQILKKSGIDYFTTTKISWNEYNKIPYDTFMWRGIDGTEILTHFITTRDPNFTLNPHITTYNGNLVPAQVIGAWERYQQKDIHDEVLLSYGYGDGGGGPTKEMLENGRRMSKGLPGCPKVKFGKAIEYFNKLEQSVLDNEKLPKWVGELYLEYHRGTYTSMARNKKFNRKSEFLIGDLEFLGSLASQMTDYKYPKKEINNIWETILLNQFHDILPGSSIKEVYEESKEQYLSMQKETVSLIQSAIGKIVKSINIEESSVVVFNQLSFNRTDIAEVEFLEELGNFILCDNDGSEVELQNISSRYEDGKKYIKYIFCAKKVPAKGYKTYHIKQKPILDSRFCSENNHLDNNAIHGIYFDILFDKDMNIRSIFDKKNQREVISSGGKANVLQAFEDKPHNHDAWDINMYYREKM